jgi:hypothetical protein
MAPHLGPALDSDRSLLAESDLAMKPAGRAATAATDVVAATRDGWSIAIRAGSKPHRFIRIWAVVVEGRVFVRSWSLEPRSWYKTLLVEPHGVLQVGRKTMPFRAVRARGEPLKAAIDRAYLRKYARPSEAGYARDLCGPRSRATTTELIPDLESSAEKGPVYRAPRARAARA